VSPVSTDALALIAKINKEHGEGAACFAAEMKVAQRFTSGSLSLDIALGGGWPGNQWVEVIGKESNGKTALVLKTLAANQKKDINFTCLWVAAEHYDTDQAEALGVDNDRVIVLPTQAMEFAYQTMLDFATSRSVDMIVLDSYPALIADEESEKDMDEATMTLGARLTGKFFRKAGNATKRSMKDPDDRPMLGIVINQFRDAIGKFSPHGTPTTTPGGNGKNYAFYTRVEVRRDEYILEARPGKGKVNVGQVIKVKTIKNKSAAPQQIATIDFYFRKAPYLNFLRGEYDTTKEIMTMGILFDIIKRKGAYFEIDNGKYDDKGKPVLRWQGKEPMLQAIREDPDLQESLYVRILAASTHADERSVTEEDLDAAQNAGTKKVSRRRKSGVLDDGRYEPGTNPETDDKILAQINAQLAV
jgi:recombination protein RecA